MDIGDTIAANLARIITEQGTNNRAVADRANLNPTAVRDIIQRKAKNPAFATLVRIADALGVSVGDIVGEGIAARPRSQPVAVVGCVGAGARVPLVDAYAHGDGLYHVSRPPQLPANGIAAVEVEGDSMAPMYQPGHVLFFRRHSDQSVLDEDIGRPCIVEDENGMAWVKLLKRGSAPGLWNLVSLNPSAESVWDVKIKWAARVMLALPAELIEKS